MRKHIFILSLCLLAVTGFSQNSDTALIHHEIDSLLNVSRNRTEKRLFKDAMAIHMVAEKMADAIGGMKDRTYPLILFNRGRMEIYQGAFDRSNYKEHADLAEEWFIKAKKLFELKGDTADLLYITIYSALGTKYETLGQYEKALGYFNELVWRRKQVFGKAHPEYGVALNNSGNLLYEMGCYFKADSLYELAMQTYDLSEGKMSEHYATALGNRGMIARETGDYEKAERLITEAMEIREKTIGKNAPGYGQSLYSLALVNILMGKYEKGESLILLARQSWEASLGPDHPNIADCINILANLYSNLGNIKRAKNLYEEAGENYRKSIGTEHPYYAVNLCNLGITYMALDSFSKAEALFKEALALREKTVGKEHPDYAETVQSLANLYTIEKKYTLAEPLILQAKGIFEKVMGKSNPVIGKLLDNLGSLYLDTKRYSESESTLLSAKNMLEKTIGKDHADYEHCLNSLIELYVKTGKSDKAVSLQQEVFDIDRNLLLRSISFMSESEMMNYMNQWKDHNYQSLSMVYRDQVNMNSQLAPLCYDQSLFYKGFVMNSGRRIRRLAESDSSGASLLQAIKICQRQLAAEYVKPMEERKDQITLELKLESLQKEMARSVSGYSKNSQQVNWKDVQAKLKSDEASIEFVNFRYLNPGATDSIFYAALLIRKNDKSPQFVPLFEEKTLDRLMQSNGGLRADYVNSLYSFDSRGLLLETQKGPSLADLLYAPLGKYLKDIKAIYYSPAGLLHRINLAAVPVSEDQVLGDLYKISELSSTRQLVIQEETTGSKNDAVLMGGIQFDDTTQSEKENSEYVRGNPWNYLPGTEREVNALSKIINGSGVVVHLEKGSEAKEENFKAIGAKTRSTSSQSPRILHIATHGFFFTDPKTDVVLKHDGPMVRFRMSDHPMLRSGLVLAGGNNGWTKRKGLEDREDGVITAYEISQMDLSNTELVVLSACETGLGDIQGNEGVYGLQRAFKIAGAKYIIMSLWQVPDNQTTELMKAFYQNWLANNMSIPDAFRAAQTAMRQRFVDPYAWAGFVLVE